MAKNSPFPSFKTGGGWGKKLIVTAILLAVVVLIVKYPGDSGSWAKNLIGMGTDAIDGLVAFFRAVGN
ncbi:hypothetical protein BS330_42780 [Amycolatopsis keratiniphila subsp. nogabecina]|nr:hypothetical protein BS330_42780 [Amycolatopsis keratiniphila subsp. nogabecina]SDU59549.1 hypothetical protein SAMN04489733_6710 [Amycolatopsis keratiniphila]SDU59650.1 hypothetical protein SAMN04489733_6728 [Amycolatopsis keratiniphila]